MRSRRAPRMAHGMPISAIRLRRVVGLPNRWGEARRNRPRGAASFAASSRRLDVPGDARHDKNLRPPGDQLGTFLRSRSIGCGRRTECNIIRTKLGQQHGVMATFIATNADDRALTQVLSRLSVQCCVRGEMDAVSADALSARGVVLDQQRHIAARGVSSRSLSVQCRIGLGRHPGRAKRRPRPQPRWLRPRIARSSAKVSPEAQGRAGKEALLQPLLQPPLAFLCAMVRYCQCPSQITLAAALSMSARPPPVDQRWG